MKDNILLIAHNKDILDKVAYDLGKELKMRTLDYNQYVEYNLGRDEKFVIDKLGIEYYWGKYVKNYDDLLDFEDALVKSDIRICLSQEIIDKAIKDLYVVVIDIPVKEQELEISRYLSTYDYIYKSKKTKILKNFRYIKSKADVVVKYNKTSQLTTKDIVSRMLEESENE